MDHCVAKSSHGHNGPIKKISSCPVCRNSTLLFVEGEALCSRCSWDSIALSVWAGDYDQVFNQEFSAKGLPIRRRSRITVRTSSNLNPKAAS